MCTRLCSMPRVMIELESENINYIVSDCGSVICSSFSGVHYSIIQIINQRPMAGRPRFTTFGNDKYIAVVAKQNRRWPAHMGHLLFQTSLLRRYLALLYTENHTWIDSTTGLSKFVHFYLIKAEGRDWIGDGKILIALCLIWVALYLQISPYLSNN